MNPHQPQAFDNAKRGWTRCIALVFLTAVLTACGGGSDTHETPVATSAPASAVAPHPETAPSAGTIALQEQGADLNTEELASIAQTGVLPTPFEGSLLSGADRADAKSFGAAPKSAASRVPVYRFFNGSTGAHFFTTSTSERDTIIATLPAFSYEGPAFYTSSIAVPGLSPVHRFYNSATGVHFYTISESERAHIAATLPTFAYEGVAYHASALPGPGYTPLYRFFYAARGFHFYTNSVAERDRIIATLPQYSYENVGYYVLGEDWRPAVLPHSGMLESQCYETSSDVMVPCSSAGALALNADQDGHRTAINPMSYGQYTVLLPTGMLRFPLNQCVEDKLTGLMWEGKATSGARSATNTYTNHGDNRLGDASTYVRDVNAMRLCGFSDWRLPSWQELQGLVIYGIRSYGAGGTGSIDAAWFTGNAPEKYWSASQVPTAALSWYLNFYSGSSEPAPRSELHRVRLVRGTAWSGPRYTYISVAYGTDAANNVVNDNRTGLQWRRCSQGQSWNGSSCTGAVGLFSQQQALLHASAQTGWRMPNVKEMASLLEDTQFASFDAVAFPNTLSAGVTNGRYWSSTPSTASYNAYAIVFGAGSIGEYDRSNAYALRLLRKP